MSFESPSSDFIEPSRRKEGGALSSPHESVSSIDTQSKRLDQKIQAQSRTYVELRECLGYKREQFEHGKFTIDFVGVAHEPETLLRRRAEIEEAIREADFVVLEAFHTLATNSEQKNPSEIAIQDFSVEELADMGIEKRGPVIFFGEIQNIARKYKKPIVSLDPLTSARVLLENNGKNFDPGLEAVSTEKSNSHLKVGALGIAPAVGWTVGEMLRKTSEQSDSDKPANDEKGTQESGLSRRALLKRGVQAVAFAVGGKSLLNAMPSQYDLLPKTLANNLQDYRDVIVATGLDTLEQKFSRQKRVAVIYGAAHASGVRAYLGDQQTRTMKKKSYADFEVIAKPEMRAYVYQAGGVEVGGAWQEQLRQSF